MPSSCRYVLCPSVTARPDQSRRREELQPGLLQACQQATANADANAARPLPSALVGSPPASKDVHLSILNSSGDSQLTGRSRSNRCRGSRLNAPRHPSSTLAAVPEVELSSAPCGSPNLIPRPHLIHTATRRMAQGSSEAHPPLLHIQHFLTPRPLVRPRHARWRPGPVRRILTATSLLPPHVGSTNPLENILLTRSCPSHSCSHRQSAQRPRLI